MVYIAKRMQDKPNRVQTVVEGAYDLTYNQIARGNMPADAAAKWFPFVATLFFFIWFSNMIGYIPLPVNTERDDRHLRARASPPSPSTPPRPTSRSRWCSR